MIGETRISVDQIQTLLRKEKIERNEEDIDEDFQTFFTSKKNNQYRSFHTHLPNESYVDNF